MSKFNAGRQQLKVALEAKLTGQTVNIDELMEKLQDDGGTNLEILSTYEFNAENFESAFPFVQALKPIPRNQIKSYFAELMTAKAATKNDAKPAANEVDIVKSLKGKAESAKNKKIEALNAQVAAAEDLRVILASKAGNERQAADMQATIDRLKVDLKAVTVKDFTEDETALRDFINENSVGEFEIDDNGIVFDSECEDFIRKRQLTKGLALLPGSIATSEDSPIFIKQANFVKPTNACKTNTSILKTSLSMAAVQATRVTAGQSWGAAADYSGGTFVGNGVAGWSMSTHAGGSNKSETSTEDRKSSAYSSYIKVFSNEFPITTLSLESSDYELTLKLTEYLLSNKDSFLAAAGPERTKAATKLFRKYGSHICPVIEIGGWFLLEAVIDTTSFGTEAASESAFAAATTLKISASAAYAGAGGVHKGGTATDFSNASTNTTVSKDKLDSIYDSTNINISAYPGLNGSVDPNIWRSNLMKNKESWSVINRDKDKLKSLWDVLNESTGEYAKTLKDIANILELEWTTMNAPKKVRSMIIYCQFFQASFR